MLREKAIIEINIIIKHEMIYRDLPFDE